MSGGTGGISALLSLPAFLLPFLHHFVFFLIHLLRFCLFPTVLQHIRQHTVILFIELCIPRHIPADLLFADLETFHHLAIQDLVAQKTHFRKILFPQFLNLLLLGLGQVSYRFLQKIQLCGAIGEQICHTVLLRLSTVQCNGNVLILRHSIHLFYVRYHIIFHIDSAVLVRLSDLRYVLR